MFQVCEPLDTYFYKRFLLSYYKIYHLPRYPLPKDTEWILDSGGYTIGMRGMDYKDMPHYEKYWTCEAYAHFIDVWKPNIAFTMDYAVKENTRKKDIGEKQDKTNTNTAKLLDLITNNTILANILQGWEIDDYLTHIDKMKETGTLTDYIGLGLPPAKLNHTRIVEEIVVPVKEALPGYVKLHGLGFTADLFIHSPNILDKLVYSADTAYK